MGYTSTVSVGLAEVFQQHTRNADARRCAAAELERRLHAIIDACRAAWPRLDLPADAFVHHLAEHLPEDGDLDSALSRVHCPDLYLACGCAAGDPAAFAAFDAGVLDQAVPVLHRMGLSASRIDEVIQVMRTKLLVAGGPQQRPSIATYAGRGSLVGWVRTATRRTALSLRRNMAEQLDGNDVKNRAPERMPFPADLELDYIKGRYQAEFKRAVEDAIAALEPEQRKLLGLHYSDGLSIDRIGALLGVHRATAARRIRAASDAVRDETRRLLHERLRLSAGEIDSLAGLVQSQLHLSLSRVLQRP